MKHFYSLPTFFLFVLCSLPGKLLAQCASRPAGADRYTAIDAGMLTVCSPVFSDTRNNTPANCYGNFFDSVQGGQPNDDIFYKFTLSSKQKVTISHCGSGVNDTFMSLLDGSGSVLAIVDDTTKSSTTYVPNAPCGSYAQAGIIRVLPAGTYYVVSEAYGTNSGDIKTQISVLPVRPAGATLATAIDAGTVSSCGFLFSDKRNNAFSNCYGNDFGQASDDIFYKFLLTSSTEVSIDLCNSSFNTFLTLLNGAGNQIAVNDDNGPLCSGVASSLKLTLAAGTYYVVSEGYSSQSGDITTRISTPSQPPLSVFANTPTTIAPGGSASLVASGPFSDYSWSPAMGLNKTSGSNVIASPKQTTTYTVVGVGQTGCGQLASSITVTVSSVPAAPSNPSDDVDRNWSRTRTYDLNGNLTGDAKQFVDVMGRATQSQTKNIAANQVFASQVVNSTGGKPVLTTLPAPINNQEFKYRTDFMTAGGNSYAAANFEGANLNKPSAPDSITPGTLGYYYSQNNTWEPATAATRSPFSLSEPTMGPLGGMRRAAGPGDKFRMGAGHETKGRDFPLLNELDHYSSLRPTFVPGSATTSLRAQGMKVVSVNPNGVESLAFANREG